MLIKNKIYYFISQKINRSDNERSAIAIKNIFFSFGIKGCSILISLLIVPLTIGYVNASQYGIWLTLSSVIAWFSFFDIGFGNGLRNRFAEAKATGNYFKAKTYISTTYVCLGIIFIFVWFLFLFINLFVNWSIVLKTPSQMAKELSVVAVIVFTFFCMQIVLKTINTVLIADQQPAKSAFFDMWGQILSLLLIFILTKTTHGSLFHLALALGISPVVVMLLASFWFYNKEYKKYRPSIQFFEKKAMKDILNLGGKFFLIQITAIAIYQTTNIIITQVAGPENVTVYNVAYKYFSIIIMISGIVLLPYWSAFTDAYTLKDYDWMRQTYKKLLYVMLLLSLFVMILLLISPFFYKLWVGNLVDVPVAVSLAVSAFVISNIFAGLYAQILNGVGKINLQLILSSISIFINIPLSLFLGKKMGVVGVILPSFVLNIIAAIFYSKQVKLILSEKAKGIWSK